MTDKNAMSFAVIIAALLISSSVFYLGYSLNKNKNNTPSNTNTALEDKGAKPAAQIPAQDPKTGGVVKISIDDDPVLGDKNAAVTLVEFSDFECPFCARHSVLTNPQIVSEFVDTGKVKIVYRDTPFHGEGAISKANAANCVFDQLGDEAYFTIKDGIYEVLNKGSNNAKHIYKH
jgi:protein-disulfide isomerase